MDRRSFLRRSARVLPLAAVALAFPPGCQQLKPSGLATKRRELRITRILIQEARGRRLTPVAPNAYAPYRGFDVREPVLRLQTEQGLEGICHNPIKPELLKPL